MPLAGNNMQLPYNIILASNSPRRRELLAGLGLDFTVKVIDGIDGIGEGFSLDTVSFNFDINLLTWSNVGSSSAIGVGCSSF